MTKERLIKKYANRRLYDASISRHVTLEDIRDLIVRGEKIRVVEDKTGEDITRLILLQVIAEQEQFGKPILTCQLLESIIRYYGGPMQDFMAGYLEQSVAAFMQQQENVQQQISQMLTSAPPPMNAMAEITGRISRCGTGCRKACSRSWVLRAPRARPQGRRKPRIRKRLLPASRPRQTGSSRTFTNPNCRCQNGCCSMTTTGDFARAPGVT